jgi:hypothetical protein
VVPGPDIPVNSRLFRVTWRPTSLLSKGIQASPVTALSSCPPADDTFLPAFAGYPITCFFGGSSAPIFAWPNALSIISLRRRASLITANHNKDKHDRTLWHRVNYDALARAFRAHTGHDLSCD